MINIEKTCRSFNAWKNCELIKYKLKDDLVYERYYNEFECSKEWNEYQIKNEMLIYYGEIFAWDPTNLEQLKMLVELIYNSFLTTKDTRYEYTKSVNEIFARFNMPLRLKSGKLTETSYKTSNPIDKIISYSMFERKINYAEEMIFYKDIQDKKMALDCIVDALQYIVSIQNGKTIHLKKQEIAKLINMDENSKDYSVILEELNQILKMSNEYYDIRHNEYLNKSKEKRESLNDPLYIEYLYNRIYGFLYLIRLKYVVPIMDSNFEISEEFELPF
ncbi:MAG: hypothetical protein PHX04_06695 [Bacilli bacterium]|nr:hypothetical protein [Bacilli bacterium]